MSLFEELQNFVLARGCILVGTPAFGWHDKSVGQQVAFENGSSVWAQLSFHKTDEAAHVFIERIREKDTILGLKAPQIYESDVLPGSKVFCMMSYVQSPVFSKTTHLQEYLELNDSFWEAFEGQQHLLQNVKTSHISCRQDLVRRRIQERYGENVPYEISQWGTIQGDLHWGNITHDCTWLDWEGWGKGPRDLDLAFLYGYTACVPDMCLRLEKRFPHLFETRDGLICLLFVCSELLRMIELYDDHPELERPLKILDQKILHRLSTL